MRSSEVLLCILVSVTLLTSVLSSTYFFGEQTNSTRLIYRDKLRYEAIPLKKRVKMFSYNGTAPIKPDVCLGCSLEQRFEKQRLQSPQYTCSAISCYDYQNSEASVNITEGGIGYKHVTLRLKSQRSYRLDYAIEIYA